MSARHAFGWRQQRGAASLIVVLVLFFLLSLTAAYTSRNLIFDQRTSLNQYRATQAFEAAEAGAEWALAMLNAGRIGDDCTEASATATSTSFRQRYLGINIDSGMVMPLAPGGVVLTPTCVADGVGGWRCNCPTNTAPTLNPPVDNAVYPAFRVRFTLTQRIDPGNDDITQPGVVIIESNGCTRLDNGCLAFGVQGLEVEGRATVAVVAVLKSALVSPPAAAVTLSGSVSVPAALRADNRDPQLDGYTIQAAGDVPLAAIADTRTSMVDEAGVPNQDLSVVRTDSSMIRLRDLDAALPAGAPPFWVFSSFYSATPDIYRQQPATVSLRCNGGCRAALDATIAANPGRVIWVTDDLVLDSAGDVGSVTAPAVIVASTGVVNFAAAGVRIFGLVHSRGGTWSGTGEINGAAVIEGNLAGGAAATVIANNTVLKSLRRSSGSFVRGLGGWNDFRPQIP